VTSFDHFLARYPEYATTRAIDDLRAADYGRLDAKGHAYLDYTGGSLHATSQVREHMDLLNGHVFGNPHSASPCSAAMTTLVEQTRRDVLDFFHAAGDYTAIFTPNASGALKLVAESYPFGPDARLLLSTDNHNSVNGIREFARGRGASVDYAPLTVPDLTLDRPCLDRLLDQGRPGRAGLFAFPAQSNFSGVKHPLELVERARAKGWDVLLDAAAFVPSNLLDLRVVQPDLVVLSFYKMFGYPTGVGCLLARREMLSKLSRPWFAGGTVNFVSVRPPVHILSGNEAGFEDGTLNYLSIPAVSIGLRHLQRIGLDQIQVRVRALTAWLLEQLLALRHGNGRPLVRLYGPTTTARGGTITMNFYDPEGHLIDYRRVEELAGGAGISLRTGCFCNPGCGETAEGVTEADVLAALESDANLTLPRFLQVIELRGGKSAGAIRVSLGIVSNFDDVDRFLRFAEGFCDQTKLAIGAVTFDIESCRVVRDGS
jgi:selenocysteine lyase/cysteine desulfurase